MAICFKGNGVIFVKKEKIEDFSNDFEELQKKYDGFGKCMHREDGLFQFLNYARHYFMPDVKELLEKYAEWIVAGRLWFDCDDEDGSVESPFPFSILIEIVDGKVFEEELKTRLGCQFDMHADFDWFNQVSKNRNDEMMEIINKFEEKRQKENKDKPVVDDGLPF